MTPLIPETPALPDKKHVYLDYRLDHYESKGFWVFEIMTPRYSQASFKKNLVQKIFSHNNEIILETDKTLFILTRLTQQALKDFNQNQAFYFRFFNQKKEVINTIASHPL